MQMNHYSNFLELPFLFIAVIFAFRTANALKGGVFGKGMLYIALGALVMGIGHLHMLVAAITGFNLFNSIFGKTAGEIVWVIALITTWVLTGYGFFSIAQASQKS